MTMTMSNILSSCLDLRYPKPDPEPGLLTITRPEPDPKSKSAIRQALLARMAAPQKESRNGNCICENCKLHMICENCKLFVKIAIIALDIYLTPLKQYC